VDPLKILKDFLYPTQAQRRKQIMEDLELWQMELGLMAKIKESDPGRGDNYWLAHSLHLNATAEIDKIRAEISTWE